MWTKPLAWKAELGSAPTFSAQLGHLITYYAVTQTYGHLAYVKLRGSRGSLKRLGLGSFIKIEQAKEACERHYAAGCDLSKAKKIVR
jgi:hypothetical protein